MIQVSSQLAIIRIERHDNAGLVHESAVVGNRIVDLELVRPPVRKSRPHSSVTSHRIGHLVSLQDVLESPNAHVELVQCANQRQDFVLSVAVTMDPAFPVEYFGDRVQLQVAPRRDSSLRSTPLRPPLSVCGGGFQLITHDLLHAHPRLRISRGVLVAPVALFHVFAKGKLDAGRRFRELHLFGQGAPPQFDDLILAADRICRTVQNVGRRDASGQLTVNVDIVGIDEISDSHFSSHRLRALVHASVGGHVRMAIDNARRQMFAATVDYRGAGGRLNVGTHREDPPTANQYRSVLQNAAWAAGPDRSVLEQHQAPLSWSRDQTKCAQGEVDLK